MKAEPSPALAEAIERAMKRDLGDADAHKYVEVARKTGTAPHVEYRCEHGCGLLAAWQTKRGLLVAHIKVRQARTRSRQLSNPGGLRLETATDSTRTLAARAYVLDDRPILLTCEHRWQAFDRAELLADVAAALETRRTIERTLAGQ